MVLRSALTLAAIGLMLGLAGAIALGRILTSVLYETSPTDPSTLAIVSVLLLAAAAAASLGPALRSAHIDPAVALREE